MISLIRGKQAKAAKAREREREGVGWEREGGSGLHQVSSVASFQ
jgi:hypothetical protein